MDKHDRPYRCVEPQCLKLLGFTSSGGLRRHECEVHGKHGAAHAQLLCPFEDCRRHSGKGFNRKQNLKEHIRRIHRQRSTEETVTESNGHPSVIFGKTNDGSVSAPVDAPANLGGSIMDAKDDLDVVIRTEAEVSATSRFETYLDPSRRKVNSTRQDSDRESVATDTTVESMHSEDEIFGIEQILAEKKGMDGEPFYLVKWEGYPLHRCTWQKECDFERGPMLVQWTERKEAAARGEGPQLFDVSDFYKAVDAEEHAKEERADKRRLKRNQFREVPREAHSKPHAAVAETEIESTADEHRGGWQNPWELRPDADRLKRGNQEFHSAHQATRPQLPALNVSTFEKSWTGTPLVRTPSPIERRSRL